MASPAGRSRTRYSKIPEFLVGPNGQPVPAVGLGTASHPFVAEDVRAAVLTALEVGYRHLDTAALYASERVVGEAMAEAVQRGIVASREELFVTSKVWCTQCHPELVLPSLRESLLNLQMEYVDLYLIHWPMAVKPSKPHFPMKREDIVPMDLSGVWQAMEECHRLGLAKMIGVSNFTTKKLQELLAIAKIPPAVNQVELNPTWQQKKLIDFCKDKGIHVAAYSPLGGQRISKMNPVRQSEVLEEIGKARGKSVAQISLRWIYEQGASMVVKSLNRERLEENIEIFNWELSDEDRFKIAQISQRKLGDVKFVEEEEDIIKKDSKARPECVVFSVGKLKVNGIGALCSFGVAAATVCIFLIGGRLHHHHRQQQQQQKIQLQFYGDDKRIQQVVQRIQQVCDGRRRFNKGEHFIRWLLRWVLIDWSEYEIKCQVAMVAGSNLDMLRPSGLKL